ncbi:A/G-specific adenine glycosylase, partial [Candidatus Woesebacteria bacterium]|nr:A/G-specific adenine glycosylase [Candidatus Woesebacteria bacterium]
MLGKVKKTDVANFQQFILWWYSKHGRYELPWRNTTDPYKILVSELMLQQTQVERVITKYLAFLETFPSTKVLAQASLAEVLSLWQGLGYNRRAKFLWQTAQKVHTELEDTFPSTADELQKLPGIGPYTATAISTFAFNNPEVVIETNIRSIYIYHFFPKRTNVEDAELLPLIEATIYTNNPREWYAALMDYGSHLKKIFPNPSRNSKHHTKQSRFEGSPRQVRGEIIRYLTQHPLLTEVELKQEIKGEKKYFEKVLGDLLAE